ncbi:MAG: CpsD/CapB family tyrosine-protein kinase [Clostridia bacterium]|nr:CpsD/CapB family tyrosine-protein kinase [Clostridia bacterium]
MINFFKKLSKKSFDPSLENALPTLLDENAPFRVKEAFRNLKVVLTVTTPKNEGGAAITVTSSWPAEGKSTIAVNSAVMFTKSNAKVVLVDADLRRGKLAKLFSEKSKPGLSDYIVGDVEYSDIIRPVAAYPGLSYIARGTKTDAAYELLESQKMKDLIKKLKAEYDYVIIDTPPLLSVSDALAIAPETDGTVLVARHKFTNEKDIEESIDLLKYFKANVLGVAVNDHVEDKLSRKHKSGLYYYYSDYTAK